jgi:two-component system chemotaxis response regulator CheY
MGNVSEANRGCVLIVDDDPHWAQALWAALELEQYRVVTVGNGEEALTRLRAGLRPQVVLLDGRMPQMTGAEFLIRHKTDPALSHIPVVALSAEWEFAPLMESLGAVAFLRKPVELDALLGLLAAICPARPAAEIVRA